ncbi:hypothetical protein AB1E19_015362 [Capra hircus]
MPYLQRRLDPPPAGGRQLRPCANGTHRLSRGASCLSRSRPTPKQAPAPAHAPDGAPGAGLRAQSFGLRLASSGLYPVSEVKGSSLEELPQLEARGGGQEERPHVQGVVAARAPEGLEELFHVQGSQAPPPGSQAPPSEPWAGGQEVTSGWSAEAGLDVSCGDTTESPSPRGSEGTASEENPCPTSSVPLSRTLSLLCSEARQVGWLPIGPGPHSAPGLWRGVSREGGSRQALRPVVSPRIQAGLQLAPLSSEHPGNHMAKPVLLRVLASEAWAGARKGTSGPAFRTCRILRTLGACCLRPLRTEAQKAWLWKACLDHRELEQLVGHRLPLGVAALPIPKRTSSVPGLSLPRPALAPGAGSPRFCKETPRLRSSKETVLASRTRFQRLGTRRGALRRWAQPLPTARRLSAVPAPLSALRAAPPGRPRAPAPAPAWVPGAQGPLAARVQPVQPRPSRPRPALRTPGRARVLAAFAAPAPEAGAAAGAPMSQRFVVTPAAGGAGDAGPRPGGGGGQSCSSGRGPDADPAASPEPPAVDALPILRYCREPSRYYGSPQVAPLLPQRGTLAATGRGGPAARCPETASPAPRLLPPRPRHLNPPQGRLLSSLPGDASTPVPLDSRAEQAASDAEQDCAGRTGPASPVYRRTPPRGAGQGVEPAGAPDPPCGGPVAVPDVARALPGLTRVPRAPLAPALDHLRAPPCHYAGSP